MKPLRNLLIPAWLALAAILAPFAVEAGSFTDFLENKLADHLFRTTTYTAPATGYVALFTAAT